MKRLLVSYEIAKQLKEKGFAELADHFYSQDGKLYPRILTSSDEPVDFEPDDFYENFNNIEKYEVEGKYQSVISAPLQQQVIDWFRNNHKIHISQNVSNIRTIKLGNEVFLYSGQITRYDPHSYFITVYLPYEEAMEFSIKEALKLI